MFEHRSRPQERRREVRGSKSSPADVDPPPRARRTSRESCSSLGVYSELYTARPAQEGRGPVPFKGRSLISSSSRSRSPRSPAALRCACLSSSMSQAAGSASLAGASSSRVTAAADAARSSPRSARSARGNALKPAWLSRRVQARDTQRVARERRQPCYFSGRANTCRPFSSDPLRRTWNGLSSASANVTTTGTRSPQSRKASDFMLHCVATTCSCPPWRAVVRERKVQVSDAVER